MNCAFSNIFSEIIWELAIQNGTIVLCNLQYNMDTSELQR